jgi:hypothetical protein
LTSKAVRGLRARRLNMAKTTAQATTELGRQLEKERENRGLKIGPWCAELKVSRQQYLQWRTRPVELEFVNIRRIAVVLGITIDTVFGWVEVDVPIIHEMTRRQWAGRPIEIFAGSASLQAA